MSTYVADEDDRAPLSIGRGEVSEGVRRVAWAVGIIVRASSRASSRASTVASAESTTTAESSTKTATAAESAATTEAASTTEAACEAAAASKARSAGLRASEAVFTNLDRTTLPLVSVELLNGVAGVVRIVKDYDTGALRPAIGAHVDVGANDVADLRC
jgi:hypothetical protein